MFWRKRRWHDGCPLRSGNWFLILTCWWVYSPSRQAAHKEPPLVGLSGKPILIQAEKDVASTLEKPEVRELAGRAFVVGRELKDDPYESIPQRFAGGIVWVLSMRIPHLSRGGGRD